MAIIKMNYNFLLNSVLQKIWIPTIWQQHRSSQRQRGGSLALGRLAMQKY